MKDTKGSGEFESWRGIAARATSRVTNGADALPRAVVENLATAAIGAVRCWLEPELAGRGLLIKAASLLEELSVDPVSVRTASLHRGSGDPVAEAICAATDELPIDILFLGPLDESPAAPGGFRSFRAQLDREPDPDAERAIAAYAAAAAAVDSQTFSALAWLAASGLRQQADGIEWELIREDMR